ncbi:MAG: hypothetical protein O7C75_04790 [Verrucomicrobia bacterium]|nr:hypothetical protein [Verrucomicrobiota bacterium]
MAETTGYERLKHHSTGSLSAMPYGISPEISDDSVFDRHNDYLSLQPLPGSSITCRFQTFPSVTNPAAKTTGNYKLKA